VLLEIQLAFNSSVLLGLKWWEKEVGEEIKVGCSLKQLFWVGLSGYVGAHSDLRRLCSFEFIIMLLLSRVQ